MSTSLSTSLSVQRFEPHAYVESGVDFMVLSIDGATQPVYERFRRNGDLELVLSNVRRLVDAKRELRKRTPAWSWNILAFEHNAHEIPLAARMARQLGVNQFRVVNPFDITWDELHRMREVLGLHDDESGNRRSAPQRLRRASGGSIRGSESASLAIGLPFRTASTRTQLRRRLICRGANR